MPCVRGCCPTPRAHFRSVNLTSDILVGGNKADQVLRKDLDAYKRLTDDGLEPNRIDGCYEKEVRGVDRHVIEGTPAGVME